MTSRMLATKAVFTGEFPLTAEFRSGPRNEKRSYEDWIDQQQMPEGYPVDLQTNVLRFAPENYKYANRFAEEHPETLVLSTWRAASGTPKGAQDDGDPLGVSNIEFPGHWVLSPGTILTSSISSSDDTLNVVSTENMRKGPALLVEIDSAGNYIWENFEYVFIQSVRDNDIEIEVKREYNGSPEARSFPSGRTHVASIPWDNRNRTPYTEWFFNLSEHCPKDARGLTAMDVIMQDMLEPLKEGGALENIGGLDLASGPLTVEPSNADYDLDGVVDDDSVYRDGVDTFYKRIRNTLGPERVLTTSLDYEFLEYINGVNQEGLAAPDDPWEEVAETVNELLAWHRMAKLPVVSLAFQQNMDREEDLLRVQMSRLLNGYSSCLGMAADIETGSGSDALDALKRLELYKGDEKEPHWLGKAIGGVKRPASMTPNLLNGAKSPTDWGEILPALSILRGSLFVDGDELVLRPDAGDFPGYVTLDLNFDLSRKTDFTVFMEAKTDDDQIRRKILLPRVSVPVDSGPLRADITSKAYLPLAFYVRGAMPGSVTIDFRFGAGGDVRFRSLSVHGATDTLACGFEKGVVLVNPSLESVNFDLENIFPGRQGYRRLSASEPDGASDIPDKYRPQLRQAMELNNGEQISNPKSLEVPQRNALFLTADAITADGTIDVSSSFADESPWDFGAENEEPDTSTFFVDEGETDSEDGDGSQFNDPTVSPTREPTASPTPASETEDPTQQPETETNVATKTPRQSPTPMPTKKPRIPPTPMPTEKPRTPPTPMPTKKPKNPPTQRPSPQPALKPSTRPTEGLEPEPEIPAPAPEGETVFDTQIWTNIPEGPEHDTDIDPEAAPLKGTINDDNSTNTNLSKMEVGVIVAFATALIAVLVGVFVLWRKRATEASRLYIRQVNEPDKGPGKTGGAPERLGETVAMETASSGQDSDDGSPESPDETIELHAVNTLTSSAIFITSNNLSCFAVQSAFNADDTVQGLKYSSNNSAGGTLEDAVEAGLWEDSVSFDTPSFDPKVE